MYIYTYHKISLICKDKKNTQEKMSFELSQNFVSDIYSGRARINNPIVQILTQVKHDDVL